MELETKNGECLKEMVKWMTGWMNERASLWVNEWDGMEWNEIKLK